MLGLGHSFQRKKDSNFGNGLKSCKCLCDNIHGETLGSKVLGMCVECEERKIALQPCSFVFLYAYQCGRKNRI